MRQLIELNAKPEFLNAASSDKFRVGLLNAKGDEPAEIAVYGEIGNPYDQADARSVGEFLRNNRGKPVNVRINSMGGLAYDGITIHNALLNHDGGVTTTIEGMAGSAASIIAMAGNPVRIYENAQIFIHRALAMAVGNKNVMDEMSVWLTTLDDAIARTYRAKTNKMLPTILNLMDGKVDGTVLSAQEAKAEGFADEILKLKTSSARAEKPDFGPELRDRAQSIEAARAERIRSRRELFAQ